MLFKRFEYEKCFILTLYVFVTQEYALTLIFHLFASTRRAARVGPAHLCSLNMT